MTRWAGTFSLGMIIAAFLQAAQPVFAKSACAFNRLDVGLGLGDLRSACLQRAGVVHYDESDLSPLGLQKQLRQHFDVVLRLLTLGTSQSVEVAIDRLQEASGHTWNAEERRACRQTLLMSRLVQLRRLADYRDRGIFPVNDGQSLQPAPIFVDRHDTACAVGHLMRCAGWADAVDHIARSNNLVYVPDAADSAISAWILTSGLTMEEAALIQPGYFWPAGQFDASAYAPGAATIEKDGLRYSNFTLQVLNDPVDSNAKPTLAGLGLSSGQGTFTVNPGPYGFPQHIPIGTHWLAVGGTSNYSQSPPPALHPLNAAAAPNHAQSATIRFDVAVIAPSQQINGISQSSYAYWQGFSAPSGTAVAPSGAAYDLDTIASDGTTTLAELYMDQTNQRDYFTRLSKTQSFTPRQQISVSTEVDLYNGVILNTYVLDFNVVPEPASSLVLAMLLTAGCGVRIRGVNPSTGAPPHAPPVR